MRRHKGDKGCQKNKEEVLFPLRIVYLEEVRLPCQDFLAYSHFIFSLKHLLDYKQFERIKIPRLGKCTNLESDIGMNTMSGGAR